MKEQFFEKRCILIGVKSKPHVAEQTAANTLKIFEKYRNCLGVLFFRGVENSFKFDCSQEIESPGAGILSSPVKKVEISKTGEMTVETTNAFYMFNQL